MELLASQRPRQCGALGLVVGHATAIHGADEAGHGAAFFGGKPLRFVHIGVDMRQYTMRSALSTVVAGVAWGAVVLVMYDPNVC